jgi:hypothetical protein
VKEEVKEKTSRKRKSTSLLGEQRDADRKRSRMLKREEVLEAATGPFPEKKTQHQMPDQNTKSKYLLKNNLVFCLTNLVETHSNRRI